MPQRQEENMRQIARMLKPNRVDMSALRISKAEFDGVVADMKANAGVLMPTVNWLTVDSAAPALGTTDDDLRAAFSDERFDTRFSDMSALMDAWVGNVNMQPMSDQTRRTYEPLLAPFDPLDLWRANVQDPSVAATLLNADLGSILDLNLVYSFSAEQSRRTTTLLEIGPGYGRLAEAAFNVFGDSIRYVMIDSVPASICYTKAYLRECCPQLRLGAYDEGDDLDLDRFQAYIGPSWHFERINTQSYDVCLNVESFQEMSQDHLDHYLGLFDSVTRDGGLIYSSNARNYAFKGDWRFPPHWRKLLAANTPRSWTDDHPTEIFLKSTGDHSLPNAALDRFRAISGRPRTLRDAARATGGLLVQRLRNR